LCRSQHQKEEVHMVDILHKAGIKSSSPGDAYKALTTLEGLSGWWTEKSHAFCPVCGSPVYLTFAAMPDLFTIHAASLDDPGRYRPQVVTYGMRGHTWDRLDPALPKFDKMPPG
jgi:hypothetical protein